ncbi:TPA: hypothetical protein N0F65_006101 [Lagenidium giganteum]|uniref:DDE Tnp4 domain-containing protein n=1 Tax=Lagenidium giganteum TaxID=4803 RepID=A0AAV2Z3P4_9STRA|nr:TPA: hypothetical protein N0F65_006101 [Lagenidium giganteum]
MKNMFYNGRTHDHYVGSVLAFTPNGIISARTINALGAMHDSPLLDWGGLYDELAAIYARDTGQCVVDSAFARATFPFLIKYQQGANEITIGIQATAVRQASEWGMRGFQGSFPRIKDRLVYELRCERKIIIFLIILLYNFRSCASFVVR